MESGPRGQPCQGAGEPLGEGQLPAHLPAPPAPAPGMETSLPRRRKRTPPRAVLGGLPSPSWRAARAVSGGLPSPSWRAAGWLKGASPGPPARSLGRPLAPSFRSSLGPACGPSCSPDAPLLCWGSGWPGRLLLLLESLTPGPGPARITLEFSEGRGAGRLQGPSVAVQWPGWAEGHTPAWLSLGGQGGPEPTLSSAFAGKGLRTAAPSPSVSRLGANPCPLLQKVDS